MNTNFWIQVQNYIRKARFRRRVKNVLAALAIVTVFVTTYALILPAITLENTVDMPGLDTQEGQNPADLIAEETSTPEAVEETTTAQESNSDQVDPVDVSGQVSGEFTSEPTALDSIEGFTMDSQGKVYDPAGQEIDKSILSESQLKELARKAQEQALAMALDQYHMNGQGQVLDAENQLVDPDSLSPQIYEALERKYINQVISLYRMDANGQIIDQNGVIQEISDFSDAAILALKEQRAEAQTEESLQDQDKEAGSHDLSLYQWEDDGLIRNREGEEIPPERFSAEELESLKQAWYDRVLSTYALDNEGRVVNAEGSLVDTDQWPLDLLQALKEKAAESTDLLTYALRMYMDSDLVIRDGISQQAVSEEKLDQLSSALSNILYGPEVNYDARLEVKDRYRAALRAQGLSDQIAAEANAEAARQAAALENEAQLAASEAHVAAEVQEEKKAILAEPANEAPDSLGLERSELDVSEPLVAQAQKAPAPALRAPLKQDPPADLDPAKNVLAQTPASSYYAYTHPENPNKSSFIRINVLPYTNQNNPGYSYTYPTAYASLLKIALSNADSHYDNGTVRLYIKADHAKEGDPSSYTAPASLSLEVSDGTQLAPIPLSGQIADPDGQGVLYYYDITGIPAGATANITTHVTYPEGSLGGNTTIWAEAKDGKTPPPETTYTKNPAGDYINFPHVVEPRDHQVKKLGNKPIIQEKQGKYYGAGLSFTVSDTVTGARKYYDGFAELGYLHSQEYPDVVKDTLTLPNSIKLRDGLSAALLQPLERHVVATPNDYASLDIAGKPMVDNFPGSLLVVNLNGQKTALAYMEESRQEELSYAYEAALDDQGRLQITAKSWYKLGREADRVALWHKESPLRYSLGNEILEFNTDPGNNDHLVRNHVEYTMTLKNKESQTSEDQTSVVLKQRGAHLTIEKSANTQHSPRRYGDPAWWTITAENDGNSPYSNLKTLRDELNENLYLSWDDLYKLFTDPGKFEGQGSPTVTITRAQFVNSPGTAPLPEALTGDARLTPNAQNRGVQTPYHGKADYDPDQIGWTCTLTITKEGNQLVLVSNQDPQQKTSIPLEDLKGQRRGSFDFFNQSYIVTREAQYAISWPYQKEDHNYTFAPGETHTYQLATTVKDSFMLLTQDQRYTHPNKDFPVTNEIDGTFEGYGSDDHLVRNEYAKHGSVYREAFIQKAISRNGEGRIDSFFLVPTYQGQGGPDVLTVTDHLMSDKVMFLAETGLNPGKNFGERVSFKGKEYGAIIEAGTYKLAYKAQGGEPLTAEVIKQADGTFVAKWHFDHKEGGEFKQQIEVLTLVDEKVEGNGSYVNETWLNDHATQRLYESTTKSPIYDFDKSIVTQKSYYPKDNKLSKHTHISAGETVTYRITLNGEKDVTLQNKDIYDLLPATPDGFAWNSSNVKVSSYDVSNRNDVKISENYRNVSISPKDGQGQQKLTWNGDPNAPLISFVNDGQAYLYLELTYPSEDLWDAYIAKYGDQGVDNTIHVYAGEDQAHHSLGNEQEVFLRKSYAGPQMVQYNQQPNSIPESADRTSEAYDLPHNWVNNWDKPLYWNSPSYYNLTDFSTNYAWKDRLSTVVYTVTLFNASNSDRFYLSTLEDSLPAGSHFGGLVYPTYSIRYYRFNPNWTSFTYAPFSTNNTYEFPVSRIVYNGKELLKTCSDYTEWNERKTTFDLHNFTVEADASEAGKLKFTISNLSNYNRDPDKVYKDDKGWYLPPQKGISFAYAVIMDKYDATTDHLDNAIRMQYTPPFEGAAVKMADENLVTESSNSLSLYAGSAEIREEDGVTYLTSQVGMDREPTQIGISKRYLGSRLDPDHKGTFQDSQEPEGRPAYVQSGYYKAEEQLQWRVDLDHKSGVVQDWSFTDSVEKPYGFDEIRFYPAGYEKDHDLFTTITDNDIYYSFKIEESEATPKQFRITLDRPPLKFEKAGALHQEITVGLDQEASLGTAGDKETPAFKVRIQEIDREGVPYQQVTLTPEPGFFGFAYPGRYSAFRAKVDPAALHDYPRFDLTTSVHSRDKAQPKLYENVARLTPSVPLVDKATSGSYDRGNGRVGDLGGPSVFDGAFAPVFGKSATSSRKQVTQLTDTHTVYQDDKGKSNTAEGNPLLLQANSASTLPNMIDLPNASTLVRYTLEVKNYSKSAYIDDLVMVDNLPQLDDFFSWKPAQRGSDFQVNLLDPDQYLTVQVALFDEKGKALTDPSGQPIVRTLSKDQYQVQYSEKTLFGRNPDYQVMRDSTGRVPEDLDWHNSYNPQKDRSFRVILRDQSTYASPETPDALIPANAVVSVSYDAKIDASYKPRAEEQIAWNSFGYRYHTYQSNETGDPVYLEAEPQKVGIRLPGAQAPVLEKRRLYANNHFPLMAEEGEKSYLFLAIKESKMDTSKQYASQLARALNFLESLEGQDLASLYQTIDGKLNAGSGDALSSVYQIYAPKLVVGSASGTLSMVPTTQADGTSRGLAFDQIGQTQDSDVYLMEIMNPSTGRPYYLGPDGKIHEDSLTSFQGLESNIQDVNVSQASSLPNSSYPALWLSPSAFTGAETQISFTATNVGKPWAINLLKLDGQAAPAEDQSLPSLAGAVFGLYSPIPSEQLSQADLQAIKSKYNFLSGLNSSMVDPKTGQTFYLKAVEETGATSPQSFTPHPPETTWSGSLMGLTTEEEAALKGLVTNHQNKLPASLRFEGLKANQYLLRELRAPAGYAISYPEPILLERSCYFADEGAKTLLLRGQTGAPQASWPQVANSDAWAVVSNDVEAGGVLPETGGMGTLPYLLGGLGLMSLAFLGLWRRRRAYSY